jgi:hypothetical protein
MGPTVGPDAVEETYILLALGILPTPVAIAAAV